MAAKPAGGATRAIDRSLANDVEAYSTFLKAAAFQCLVTWRVAVDESEKRRLKKLGKALVEQRSRQLRDRLHAANPAPVGSEEWVRGYRTGVERDRALRAAPPDRLTTDEVRAAFVPLPVAGEALGEAIGVRTYYYLCPTCGDAVHSLPQQAATCTCGNVVVDPEGRRTIGRSGEQAGWSS
jgi:hypothetical protein